MQVFNANGGGTLTIYVIHLLLLNFIPKEWSLCVQGYEWIYVTILTCALTLVSYLVHIILSKNVYSAILVGRWPEKIA